MIENSVHQHALRALQSRRLQRLPFPGGHVSQVRSEQSDGKHVSNAAPAVEELVDAQWGEKGTDDYDGELMGVVNVAISADRVTLGCRDIRYRHYVATDAVLRTYPNSGFPLAMGVHAILLTDTDVVCLRLQNGRLALPGGAVDAEDQRRAPEGPLQHAISREILEETGIDVEGHEILVTGLYVGGYPTHLLAMLLIDLGGTDVHQSILHFSPQDALDRVASIEALPVAELINDLGKLPLVMRAALQSLRHWQGLEPAWTIAA